MLDPAARFAPSEEGELHPSGESAVACAAGRLHGKAGCDPDCIDGLELVLSYSLTGGVADRE